MSPNIVVVRNIIAAATAAVRLAVHIACTCREGQTRGRPRDSTPPRRALLPITWNVTRLNILLVVSPVPPAFPSSLPHHRFSLSLSLPSSCLTLLSRCTTLHVDLCAFCRVAVSSNLLTGGTHVTRTKDLNRRDLKEDRTGEKAEGNIRFWQFPNEFRFWKIYEISNTNYARWFSE